MEMEMEMETETETEVGMGMEIGMGMGMGMGMVVEIGMGMVMNVEMVLFTALLCECVVLNEQCWPLNILIQIMERKGFISCIWTGTSKTLRTLLKP